MVGHGSDDLRRLWAAIPFPLGLDHVSRCAHISHIMAFRTFGARADGTLSVPFGSLFSMTLPPAPDAILTRDEVSAWLKVKPRQVERLGVPCLDLGRKTKRYLAKDVLAWLEVQRRPTAPWSTSRRS